VKNVSITPPPWSNIGLMVAAKEKPLLMPIRPAANWIEPKISVTANPASRPTSSSAAISSGPTASGSRSGVPTG
jgi:hypothetical protein